MPAVVLQQEIYRILKPGSLFAGYEWCATDVYNPTNAHHKQVMAEIELGNGLPDVRTTAETLQSLKAAGFEVLDEADLSLTADIPWWEPLDPDSWRLASKYSDFMIAKSNAIYLIHTYHSFD